MERWDLFSTTPEITDKNQHILNSVKIDKDQEITMYEPVKWVARCEDVKLLVSTLYAIPEQFLKVWERFFPREDTTVIFFK